MIIFSSLNAHGNEIHNTGVKTDWFDINEILIFANTYNWTTLLSEKYINNLSLKKIIVNEIVKLVTEREKNLVICECAYLLAKPIPSCLYNIGEGINASIISLRKYLVEEYWVWEWKLINVVIFECSNLATLAAVCLLPARHYWNLGRRGEGTAASSCIMSCFRLFIQPLHLKWSRSKLLAPAGM